MTMSAARLTSRVAASILLAATLFIAVASATKADNAHRPAAPTQSSGAPPTDSQKPTKSLVQEKTNNKSAVKADGDTHFTPTNADVEHFRHSLRLSRFHFALLLLLCGACGSGVVLVVLSSVFQSRSVSAANRDAECAAKRASGRKVQEMERELQEAFTLALKTENFSEAACQAAAAARRDEVLFAHAQIAAKEAERLLNVKIHAAHFEKLAAQASSRSEMGHAALVDILRRADEWEFRVLQAAKKLALEESK